MPEVVFLVGADRAVGEEHERSLLREPLHGMIGVNPGVHALARRQLRPRRPQLRRKDGRAGAKGSQEVGDGDRHVN